MTPRLCLVFFTTYKYLYFYFSYTCRLDSDILSEETMKELICTKKMKPDLIVTT